VSNTRSDGKDGGLAGQEEGMAGSTERADSDPRGHMHREKCLTSDHDTREFLRNTRSRTSARSTQPDGRMSFR